MDVVALGTAKQTHKASFPWALLRGALKKGSLLGWIQKFKLIPKHVGDMDFSGKGMWYAYNIVAKNPHFQLKCV